MTSPLLLQVNPNSGLSFPWAFTGEFNLHLGDSGVGWVETMMINWSDLQTAVVELLGYSWRDTSTVGAHGFSQLRRKLPWQHPYFNQLWVLSISQIKGIRMIGSSEYNDIDEFILAGGAPGSGVPLNFGPWTEFERAELTIQFHRPPYFVRSDDDVRNADTGFQMEWLRYTDRNWSVSSQMLSREGSQFLWSGAPGNLGTGGYANGLPGSVGQLVSHQKLTRTWYQIPEAAIFAPSQDATPQGEPTALMYAATTVYNPITGYSHVGGYINPLIGAVNTPIFSFGGYLTLNGDTTSGSTTVAMADTTGLHGQTGGYDGDAVFGPGIRTGTSIVSVVANTSITLTLPATATGSAVALGFVSDFDESKRLFGCRMGTLRFDGVELRPRPLQLPPYLMQIPIFANNEAISQQQYDVVFHFDVFDPPRAQLGSGAYAAGAHRGHNLMPYSGNGCWYPVNSQFGASGTTTGPFLTPLPYADLSDLFQIL